MEIIRERGIEGKEGASLQLPGRVKSGRQKQFSTRLEK